MLCQSQQQIQDCPTRFYVFCADLVRCYRETCIACGKENRNKEGILDATWPLACWNSKPTTPAPRGTYQDLQPATNSFTGRIATTVGVGLWEWPVNQTHHHIQSVALLIQSKAHSVLLGDSHHGTAEKPKQTMTAWSIENSFEDDFLFQLKWKTVMWGI